MLRNGSGPSRRLARKLASPERVGRFARDVAWKRYVGQLRRNWPTFVGMGLLPLIFAIFAEFTLRGAVRWLVVGAAAISGPWLVVLAALLLSGAAPQMMGLQAEEWTAQELRTMYRKGWKVISGLKPKPNFDIDHIAIGPAGLFVVEVKWSGDQWPTEKTGNSYMRKQLIASINQVKWNLRDLKQILGDTAGALPASAVCVLWSGDSTSETTEIMEIDGVTIVPGPLLRNWLRGLREVPGAKQQVDPVWRILAEFDAEAESWAEGGVVYRPALGRLIVRWTLSVVSGFLIALSVPIVMNRLTGLWMAIFAAIIAGLVAGLITRRIERWRFFGTGLISGALVSVVILLIAVIRVMK
jgi:hypothetical protein